MANDYTILAGSIGEGVWRSPDGGETWRNFHAKQMPVWAPFNLEARVRGLASDPNNPAVIYAGDEVGICKSFDRGDNWERLHGPMDGLDIWSIAVDPANSNIVFAGSGPPFFFRSKDAGRTWEKLPAQLPQECFVGIPRTLFMRVDPLDSRNIWAGIEAAGLYRSVDGGDSWSLVWGGLEPGGHPHAMAMLPGMDLRVDKGGTSLAPGKGTTALIAAGDLLATSDVGETFQTLLHEKDFKLSYIHALAVKPDDPRVIFVGKGDTAIGSTGDLIRTKDGGATWQNCDLPVEPNSPFWGIAVHPSNPNRVVACTLFGQFYVSEDAGDTWKKLKREVNELRTLAWVPN